MSTRPVNEDTTIDIGESFESDVQTATITVIGVDEKKTDAAEINLLKEASINTETSASAVLTGESLVGTEEKPAGIALTSSNTSKPQVVAVQTVAVKNTVIQTSAPTSPDQEVAKADILLNSEIVDSVSIKTSSTAEKSVIGFGNQDAILTNVQIQASEKGADISIKSAEVDGLTVTTSGSESSNIEVSAETSDVKDAQIEISEAGGIIEINNSGTLSGSTIAVNSNSGRENTLSIDNAQVTNTQLQLIGGSSEVDVKTEVVNELIVSVDDTEGSRQNLSIEADSVTGFTLEVGSSSRTNASINSTAKVTQTSITSASENKSTFTANAKLLETNLDNEGTGKTKLNSEKRARDTELSNNGDGQLISNFAAKAVDTELSNGGNGFAKANFGKTEGTKINHEGKGRTKANFSGAAKDVDIVTGENNKKGTIKVSFDAKVDDIRIKAGGSKQAIDIEFDGKVTNAKLNFGDKADSIVFGGIAEEVSINLGEDTAADTIEIDDLSKIKSPFSISNFGNEDTLTIGNTTFTASELQEDPTIAAPIEIQFS